MDTIYGRQANTFVIPVKTGIDPVPRGVQTPTPKKARLADIGQSPQFSALNPSSPTEILDVPGVAHPGRVPACLEPWPPAVG